jgi:phenylacetate-coenzyme A ligase PaaK-like adenylate-forming protein
VRSLVATRVVQDAADHVRVEMVCEAPLNERDSATLQSELQNRLGPSMRIELVRVANLPRESSGKFRAVVNLAFPPSRLHALTDARWTTRRATRTD